MGLSGGQVFRDVQDRYPSCTAAYDFHWFCAYLFFYTDRVEYIFCYRRTDTWDCSRKPKGTYWIYTLRSSEHSGSFYLYPLYFVVVRFYANDISRICKESDRSDSSSGSTPYSAHRNVRHLGNGRAGAHRIPAKSRYEH